MKKKFIIIILPIIIIIIISLLVILTNNKNNNKEDTSKYEKSINKSSCFTTNNIKDKGLNFCKNDIGIVYARIDDKYYFNNLVKNNSFLNKLELPYDLYSSKGIKISENDKVQEIKTYKIKALDNTKYNFDNDNIIFLEDNVLYTMSISEFIKEKKLKYNNKYISDNINFKEIVIDDNEFLCPYNINCIAYNTITSDKSLKYAIINQNNRLELIDSSIIKKDLEKIKSYMNTINKDYQDVVSESEIDSVTNLAININYDNLVDKIDGSYSRSMDNNCSILKEANCEVSSIDYKINYAKVSILYKNTITCYQDCDSTNKKYLIKYDDLEKEIQNLFGITDILDKTKYEYNESVDGYIVTKPKIEESNGDLVTVSIKKDSQNNYVVIKEIRDGNTKEKLGVISFFYKRVATTDKVNYYFDKYISIY